MTDQPQPVGHHLMDLRRMLLRCLIAIGVMSAISFAYAPTLFRILQAPYTRILAKYGSEKVGVFLQSLEPAETFKLSFTVALVLGTVVILPYLLYELWRFVRPGLMTSERRWILPVVGGGTILFFVGAAFAYYAVLPLVLAFFWEYSLRLGVTPAWTIAKYIHFVLGTMVAFGMAFELPVVSTVLAEMGVLSATDLRRARRYAIFVICVLSAILTPADVVSLVLMAVPLICLYEISIVLAKLVGKQHSRNADERDSDDIRRLRHR
jgi:sec-independent protein translocase protein TatC